MATLLLKFLLLFSSLSNTLSADFIHLNNLKPKSTPEIQANAAYDLIIRTVGFRSSEFIVLVNSSLSSDNEDTFQLTSKGSRIEIAGSSGVAVSMGFYYYLKYYCKAQKTWAGEQMHLPSVLPPVNQPVKVTANDRFRYYQNVCTLSYTMAFWNWDRWEQEIDWMALRGINLPLAFIGQEAIFQRVYLKLGFTQSDLDAHFAGPAFLAWARMGNLQAWGGPLPQMWITQKLILQHKILDRMRSLGMTPVLPGFAGHVPSAITRVFPHANYTRLGLWGHFNSTYSATYLLDFEDPLFTKIGSAFIQALIDEYGTDHIYNADSFNEMTPRSNATDYLAAAGKYVFEGMALADPSAVWLMQGWAFGNSFWQPPQVKSLLTAVPQGRMIILDLQAENHPLYGRFESYYGQPFIWCMLHNFGGTMELYGALEFVKRGPFVARAYPNSTMIGTGITPEGLHQNEIVYEFMSEHAWRPKEWDIGQWMLDFATQRYGMSDPLISNASYYLKTTVYNATDYHPDMDLVLITRRPTPKFDVSREVWYNASEFFKAWDKYIEASDKFEGSELFAYDLVDITRNSLQTVALQYWALIMDGYNNKNVTSIRAGGDKICSLLDSMDALLASNNRFLLGKWLADAEYWGTNADERALYHFNARNQITLWGPEGEIVDYASKQWAGLMKDFYKPRFEYFVHWLQQLIVSGKSWDGYIFNEKILADVESPWTLAQDEYPTEPSGNPHTIAKALHAKYRPETYTPFFAKLDADRRKQPARNKKHQRKFVISKADVKKSFDENYARLNWKLNDYYSEAKGSIL